MTPITRRSFLEMALAMGATAAWGEKTPSASRVVWTERRDLYPEGVASGDPDATGMILWTRRAPDPTLSVTRLTVEVSEVPSFQRVVATAVARISEASDWTCRVLVGGLKPDRVYWYRFSDERGNGSRVGRTRTAPKETDLKPVRFAFVSCQNVNQGAQNAYRRMIYEDERAADAEQLGFVLHLGDFIYEIVWYPEDRPQGMYDRRIRDIVRYPQGEKVDDYHLPASLADYRAVYRAYMRDPDLQDARARWPFVCMWDNHEFSWKAWQTVEEVAGAVRPAQKKKVWANQAFFEYQPARMAKPSGVSLDHFEAPNVQNHPIERFDEHGLGQEPNNLAAIRSLKGHRTLRWGKNVDLLITDEHSFRSEEPTSRKEAEAFSSQEFSGFFPEEALHILDAGRTYQGGHPPAEMSFGGRTVPNYQRDRPAQTILGIDQKEWFLKRLRTSKATWKIWGSTTGTLDLRVDPQNLPPTLTKPWPGAGYAGFGGGDFSTAFVERGQIYDFVREHKITGFATIFGDRHSFWAGLAAKALPPQNFQPVGVAFGTGSISAPGLVEAYEHRFPKEHPLRALYLGRGPADNKPQPTINMLLRHGVSACLEYEKTGDITKARLARNSELSPHLSFVDMEGHGYAVVHASSSDLQVEFVCIPRPLERSDRPDGGPLRYRVRHRTSLWRSDATPNLEFQVLEGDPHFSI